MLNTSEALSLAVLAERELATLETKFARMNVERGGVVVWRVKAEIATLKDALAKLDRVYTLYGEEEN